MNPEDYKKMRAYMRNIRKKCMVIILLIIISISISPVMGGDNQSTNNQYISNKSINNKPISNNQSIKKVINYRIAIDQYQGFYRVYIANTSGRAMPILYNGILNITKGDTITWMNDAVPDARFTVISQQKLWSDNSGVLKWAYKQFSYTFNKSGIYDVYIKDSKFKQKIIVGPLESNITNKITNITNKITNTTNKITNTTNKITNTTNKITNTTNKITNTTNSSKIVNSNNLTNVLKNDEIGKYNIFMILPMIAIISIIYIRKFQKKVK